MNRYEPNDDDPLTILMTIIIGSVLFVFAITSCIGCATTKCPECVPEIKTVEVNIPVRYCEAPPDIPPLALPEYPTLAEGSTGNDVKDWYAQVVSTAKARREMLLNRIRLLEEVLEGYSE